MEEQSYLMRLIEVSAHRASLQSRSMFTKFQDKIYLTNKMGRLIDGVFWNKMPMIESYCFVRGNYLKEDGQMGYQYYTLGGVPLDFLTGSNPLIDNMWVVQEFDGIMYLARIEFSSDNPKTCLRVTNERRITGYGYLGYNTVIIKEGDTWRKYDYFDDYVLDKRFDGSEIIENYSTQDMLRYGYYPQFIADICSARNERYNYSAAEFLKMKQSRSTKYLELLGTIQSSTASIEMLSIKTGLPMDLLFLVKTVIRDRPLKDF